MRILEPALNTNRRRAAQLFAESAICGYGLGFAAAFTIALVLASARNPNAGAVIFAYSLLAGGFGGGVGVIVGLPAGVLGALVVRAGEPRLGPVVVAWLLPFVGLVATLPFALLFALPGNAGWRMLVFAIAGVLTLIGSFVVARRYLRRAKGAPVH